MLKRKVHTHKFIQEKPEDCIICTESFKDDSEPLCCGHWIHINCIKKQFKPECPICRTSLDISVSGDKPELYIPNEDYSGVYTGTYTHSRNRAFTMIVIEHIFEHNLETDSLPDLEDITNNDSWQNKGYLHPEEDEDYDEENPRGDEFSYDDI